MVKGKVKKRIRTKVVLITSLILLIIIGASAFFVYQNYTKEQERILAIEKKKKEDAKLLKDIKSHYSENVITLNDAKLYELEDKKYKEVGRISKDSYINLEQKGEVSKDDKYFKLANTNYYVFYNDVAPSEMISINYDYKNYVPFDFDIVTKNPTNFYLDDKLIYTINSSIQLPVIINEDNYYYVEYDNRLYGVKKEDVESTIDVSRGIEVATNIGVLNYHFFYDSTNEVCDEIICLKTSKFEEQLKYLKDNNFYTATMKDMSLWMSRKIRLPKKTTVLTVDDGAMGTGIENGNKLIPLLEKYDLHATLFLITGWWPKENYQSPNLEIQSHGDNIHNYTNEALYKSKQQLLDDFSLSINKLNGENTAFCYPFYAQNATVRSAVAESGFKIAFVGGNVKANQNNDPYRINRYVVLNSITLNSFINMVN